MIADSSDPSDGQHINDNNDLQSLGGSHLPFDMPGHYQEYLLPPIYKTFTKFRVYESTSNVFIVGSTSDERENRILKINRFPSQTDTLDVEEDGSEEPYNQQETTFIIDLLTQSLEGRGGLNLIANGVAILGVINFLYGFYLHLVVQSHVVAHIGHHKVYGIDDTVLLPLWNPEVFTDVVTAASTTTVNPVPLTPNSSVNNPPNTSNLTASMKSINPTPSLPPSIPRGDRDSFNTIRNNVPRDSDKTSQNVTTEISDGKKPLVNVSNDGPSDKLDDCDNDSEVSITNISAMESRDDAASFTARANDSDSDELDDEQDPGDSDTEGFSHSYASVNNDLPKQAPSSPSSFISSFLSSSVPQTNLHSSTAPTPTRHIHFRPKKYKAHETKYKSLYLMVEVSRGDFYYSYTYPLSHRLQNIVAYHLALQRAVSIQDIHSGSNPNLDPANPTPIISLSSRYTPMVPQQRFTWNTVQLSLFPLPASSKLLWVVPLLHGYMEQLVLPLLMREIPLTLIGRRSSDYAGTRYLKRGMDSCGHAANEIEVEQIVGDGFTVNGQLTSHIQLRASIPLFWTQQSSAMVAKPDITITNADVMATGTRTHVADMLQRYGSPLTFLNLIRQEEKRPRETIVGRLFSDNMSLINSHLPSKYKINYMPWDFKNIAKSPDVSIVDELSIIAQWSLHQTGFFHTHPRPEAIAVQNTPLAVPLLANRQSIQDYEHILSSSFHHVHLGFVQRGILRSNCIDSLDRTNVAQFCNGKVALAYQLYSLNIISYPDVQGYTELLTSLLGAYERLGDAIALQYGGSQMHRQMKKDGAKSTIMAPVLYRQTQHLTKSKELIVSLVRHYQNSFQDNAKQDAINVFLAKFRPSAYTNMGEHTRQLAHSLVMNINSKTKSGLNGIVNSPQPPNSPHTPLSQSMSWNQFSPLSSTSHSSSVHSPSPSHNRNQPRPSFNHQNSIQQSANNPHFFSPEDSARYLSHQPYPGGTYVEPSLYPSATFTSRDQGDTPVWSIDSDFYQHNSSHHTMPSYFGKLIYGNHYWWTRPLCVYESTLPWTDLVCDKVVHVMAKTFEDAYTPEHVDKLLVAGYRGVDEYAGGCVCVCHRVGGDKYVSESEEHTVKTPSNTLNSSKQITRKVKVDFEDKCICSCLSLKRRKLAGIKGPSFNATIKDSAENISVLNALNWGLKLEPNTSIHLKLLAHIGATVLQSSHPPRLSYSQTKDSSDLTLRDSIDNSLATTHHPHNYPSSLPSIPYVPHSAHTPSNIPSSSISTSRLGSGSQTPSYTSTPSRSIQVPPILPSPFLPPSQPPLSSPRIPKPLYIDPGRTHVDLYRPDSNVKSLQNTAHNDLQHPLPYSYLLSDKMYNDEYDSHVTIYNNSFFNNVYGSMFRHASSLLPTSLPVSITTPLSHTPTSLSPTASSAASISMLVASVPHWPIYCITNIHTSVAYSPFSASLSLSSTTPSEPKNTVSISTSASTRITETNTASQRTIFGGEIYFITRAYRDTTIQMASPTGHSSLNTHASFLSSPSSSTSSSSSPSPSISSDTDQPRISTDSNPSIDDISVPQKTYRPEYLDENDEAISNSLISLNSSIRNATLAVDRLLTTSAYRSITTSGNTNSTLVNSLNLPTAKLHDISAVCRLSPDSNVSAITLLDDVINRSSFLSIFTVDSDIVDSQTHSYSDTYTSHQTDPNTDSNTGSIPTISKRHNTPNPDDQPASGSISSSDPSHVNNETIDPSHTNSETAVNTDHLESPTSRSTDTPDSSPQNNSTANPISDSASDSTLSPSSPLDPLTYTASHEALMQALPLLPLLRLCAVYGNSVVEASLLTLRVLDDVQLQRKLVGPSLCSRECTDETCVCVASTNDANKDLHISLGITIYDIVSLINTSSHSVSVSSLSPRLRQLHSALPFTSLCSLASLINTLRALLFVAQSGIISRVEEVLFDRFFKTEYIHHNIMWDGDGYISPSLQTPLPAMFPTDVNVFVKSFTDSHSHSNATVPNANISPPSSEPKPLSLDDDDDDDHLFGHNPDQVPHGPSIPRRRKKTTTSTSNASSPTENISYRLEGVSIPSTSDDFPLTSGFSVVSKQLKQQNGENDTNKPTAVSWPCDYTIFTNEFVRVKYLMKAQWSEMINVLTNANTLSPTSDAPLTPSAVNLAHVMQQDRRTKPLWNKYDGTFVRMEYVFSLDSSHNDSSLADSALDSKNTTKSISKSHNSTTNNTTDTDKLENNLSGIKNHIISASSSPPSPSALNDSNPIYKSWSGLTTHILLCLFNLPYFCTTPLFHILTHVLSDKRIVVNRPSVINPSSLSHLIHDTSLSLPVPKTDPHLLHLITNAFTPYSIPLATYKSSKSPLPIVARSTLPTSSAPKPLVNSVETLPPHTPVPLTLPLSHQEARIPTAVLLHCERHLINNPLTHCLGDGGPTMFNINPEYQYQNQYSSSQFQSVGKSSESNSNNTSRNRDLNNTHSYDNYPFEDLPLVMQQGVLIDKEANDLEDLVIPPQNNHLIFSSRTLRDASFDSSTSRSPSTHSTSVPGTTSHPSRRLNLTPASRLYLPCSGTEVLDKLGVPLPHSIFTDETKPRKFVQPMTNSPYSPSHALKTPNVNLGVGVGGGVGGNTIMQTPHHARVRGYTLPRRRGGVRKGFGSEQPVLVERSDIPAPFFQAIIRDPLEIDDSKHIRSRRQKLLNSPATANGVDQIVTPVEPKVPAQVKTKPLPFAVEGMDEADREHIRIMNYGVGRRVVLEGVDHILHSDSGIAQSNLSQSNLSQSGLSQSRLSQSRLSQSLSTDKSLNHSSSLHTRQHSQSGSIKPGVSTLPSSEAVSGVVIAESDDFLFVEVEVSDSEDSDSQSSSSHPTSTSTTPSTPTPKNRKSKVQFVMNREIETISPSSSPSSIPIPPQIDLNKHNFAFSHSVKSLLPEVPLPLRAQPDLAMQVPKSIRDYCEGWKFNESDWKQIFASSNNESTLEQFHIIY